MPPEALAAAVAAADEAALDSVGVVYWLLDAVEPDMLCSCDEI